MNGPTSTSDTAARDYPALRSQLARYIERTRLPRLQMFGMIAVSALSGFLVTFALLHAGVPSMAYRYAASWLVSYAVFMGSLRLLLIAGAIGFLGTVGIVVNAPAFLAELLLDGVIAGAAYRRLRHVARKNWLHGAIRRTLGPMIALLVGLLLVAVVAQSLQPGITSLGDLFR